jgi:hypothetical protein
LRNHLTTAHNIFVPKHIDLTGHGCMGKKECMVIQYILNEMI